MNQFKKISVTLALISIFTIWGCKDKKAGGDFSGNNKKNQASGSGGSSEQDNQDAVVNTPEDDANMDQDSEDSNEEVAGSCLNPMIKPIAEGTPATVRGINFDQKAEVCGEKLSLIGSGIRQRLGDRYILSAYTKTETCTPQDLINTDEHKFLKINVLTDTSADLVSSSIEDAINANLPANIDADLRAKIDTVVAAFNVEFTVGLIVDLIYVPNMGTTFRMQGKPDQMIAGAEINKILWSAFFSENTCCPNAKTEILAYCAAQNP